jgi:hypothetical protein
LSNLFALVILVLGSHFWPRQAWTMSLLFYTFCHHWDDRYMPPQPVFPVEMGVLKTLLSGLA